MKQLKKVVVGIASAALVSMAAFVFAGNDSEAIAERLKPVGKVCMAGDDCAGGASVVAAGEARSGEEIYTTKCFSCHASGVGGAPKLGDTAAWASRLEQGMEKLFENGWNGINAMPPRGICMDCSEEEFQSTIDYILEQNK
ncbi:MAG: c-type cytochrome [Cellvibrionaceae bacterium]